MYLNKLKIELLKSALIVALALLLSLGILYVHAWTGPDAAPPVPNTPAPINVGATAQTKTGGLTVGSLGVSGNTINVSGAESTYGAVTVRGVKNTYSGINFRDSAGNNLSTLMMNAGYSGFYNVADNGWRWYIDNVGNSYQNGYVTAPGICLNGDCRSAWPGASPVTLTCSRTGNNCGPSRICTACVNGVCSDPATVEEDASGCPTWYCFIAGTQVLLADGTSTSIEDVEIGDRLLGGNGSINEVLGFLHHPKGESKRYGFNGEEPFATEDHPFMTTEGWKSINPDLTRQSSPGLSVGRIEVGDVLITRSGTIAIESIEEEAHVPGETVYNFILGGNHTYYANGYLVSDYYKREN
jgi:hypothetical protein